jgi:excisionase family DNA binding protein
MATSTLDPITLPHAQEEQVSELRDLLQKEGSARLVGRGGEPAVELPDAIFGMLVEIVGLMEQGKAVSIVPVTQELTTQQAAELIGVSRPFLVKLLEAGKISFHQAGTHRRVYLKDLLEYKQQRDRDRHEALNRMSREAEADGLYDKVLLPEE